MAEFIPNLDDYEILADICNWLLLGGIDDFSFVYMGRHKKTGMDLAIKLTDLGLTPEYEFVLENIKAAKNARLMRHPNIINYYTTFLDQERLFAVTEPIYGTCKHLMTTKFQNGFDEILVASIIKEVLKALEYLHQERMIHNNVRADNIVLTHTGVKLSGLRQMASLSKNGGYMRSVFSLVGDNVEWAAPEVISQNTTYNEKADVYSLGVTCIELLCNKTPFDAWPPLKILLSKLKYDFPKPNVPKSKSLLKFLRVCLQTNPKDRPLVRQLLDHSFVKQAKGNAYIINCIQSQ